MYCFVQENHDDRIRNKPLKGFTESVFIFKKSTEQMWLWPEQRWISTYRNDLSATGRAFTDILVIEKPDDRIQLFRDSKDHMEVWRIQYIFPSGIHPLLLWKLLAHGTAPVTAGIVVN